MDDLHELVVHTIGGIPAGTYEGRHATSATEFYGKCICGWRSNGFTRQREVRRSYQRHVGKVNGEVNAGSDTTPAHVEGAAFRRNRSAADGDHPRP